MSSPRELTHPSRPQASAAAQVIAPHGGWLFSLRFPDGVEAEFRAHYFDAFRSRMRTFWYLIVLGWVLSTVVDWFLFPDFIGRLLAIRVVGLAVVLAGTAVVMFPESVRGSLHAVTAASTTGICLCTIALFAATPFPRNWIYFAALAILCIITTIFLSTLHYEYSAMGSLVVGVVFAAVAFSLLPPAYAAGMAAGVAVVLAFSLSCTNFIESYARVNFAQSRALEEQSAAIAEKARQLEISEGKARDANRAKSVFLSNMSHELRTPLNAVLGFAQFLERETGLSPDGRNNLRIIQRSGGHLLELINDVLAISKIEAGRITLAEHTFDLHEMIRSVADMIRVRTEPKGLQFIVSIEPDVPRTVTGDEGKLRQVLVNLLGNAVKFTDEGGIALRAGWSGSAAVIELQDTGHGIAAEEMGGLFEAFTQTESGRNSKEGTGLGLAISRSFVRLMGGDIRVRSELGRGTVFTVEVPLAVAESHAPETARRRVTGLAPGETPRRLLVVDDTAENRHLLTSLLTTVGFEVREATNGREAVDAWADWRPDLIWMDMRMPVMDGYEATREIRRREVARGPWSVVREGTSSGHSPEPSSTDHGPRTTDHCRIIALTASAFEHERAEILSQGVDDFVAKPFREESIFEKLAEHLGVRYAYEDAGAPAEARGESVVTPERLSALPGEQIRELYGALSNGDIAAAAAAAESIRERDESLGIALLAEIRAFRLEELLSVLDNLEPAT